MLCILEISLGFHCFAKPRNWFWLILGCAALHLTPSGEPLPEPQRISTDGVEDAQFLGTAAEVGSLLYVAPEVFSRRYDAKVGTEKT